MYDYPQLDFSSTFRPADLPRLVQVIPPSEYPVTLNEVKVQCRIDFVPEFPDGGTEDTLLTALIAVATRSAENATRRALMTQTWKKVLDCFSDEMRLEYPPIQALTIRYRDIDGVWQNLAPENYVLSEGDYPRIHAAYGVSYPTTYSERGSVELIWQCGYLSAADVPVGVKQWILCKVGELFENRERSSMGNVQTHNFIDELLSPYVVNPIPYTEVYAR